VNAARIELALTGLCASASSCPPKPWRRRMRLCVRGGLLLPSAFNVSRVRTDLCGLAPRRLGAKRPSLLAVPPSLPRHSPQAHSGSFRVIQGNSSQTNTKKTFRPAPPLLRGLQPVRHGSPIDGGSSANDVGCPFRPLRSVPLGFPPSIPHPLGILSNKVTPRVPLRLCAFHPLRLIPPPRHAAPSSPKGMEGK
jgi:hypothetical protein